MNQSDKEELNINSYKYELQKEALFNNIGKIIIGVIISLFIGSLILGFYISFNSNSRERTELLNNLDQACDPPDCVRGIIP